MSAHEISENLPTLSGRSLKLQTCGFHADCRTPEVPRLRYASPCCSHWPNFALIEHILSVRNALSRR